MKFPQRTPIPNSHMTRREREKKKSVRGMERRKFRAAFLDYPCALCQYPSIIILTQFSQIPETAVMLGVDDIIGNAAQTSLEIVCGQEMKKQNRQRDT